MPGRLSGDVAARRERCRRGGIAALVLGAASGLATSAPTHGAPLPETVEVRAATHADFGRLVLEWPGTVDVDHERDGNRFVVRFDRPFDADLSIAPTRLGEYLGGIEVGADGRAAVLDLEPGVTPSLEVHDGRIVVVDLRGPAAERFQLRTGIHEHYARIVLDWAEPIDFDARIDDGSVRIGVPRPLPIDAPALVERLPDWLRSADVDARADRNVLRLGLREGVLAVVFGVEGDRVVVDLHEPSSPTQSASSGVDRKPSGSAPTVAGRAPPAPATGEGSPATPEIDPVAPDAISPVEAAHAGGVARVRATVEARPIEVGELEPAGGAQADGVAMAPPAEPVRLQLDTEVDADGRALVFEAGRPIGATVLLRAGHLWAVFAEPDGSGVEPPSRAPAIAGFLGPGEPIRAEGGVAIRFALRRPLDIRVEREAAGWRIRLLAKPVAPSPIEVVRILEPDRLHLVGEPFGRVRVRDPDVGDVLEFWPLLDARGLPRSRRLVDLEMLPTAQGIALRLLADGVRSRVGDGRIDLPTTHGPAVRLAPSDAVGAALVAPGPTPARSAPVPVPPMPPTAERFDDRGAVGGIDGNDAPPGPLGLARLSSVGPATFQQRRSELMRRASIEDPALREAARLDLARLFLSQAMAAETLAVLEVMDDGEATDANGPLRIARQGLAGAAELLMGRLEQARAALDHPKLAGEPEIALWRAALAAAEQDWARAAAELGRSERTLDHYPPRLQLRLGLPAAMIALEAGNRDLATLVLARLDAAARHPLDRERVRFLQGLAKASAGEIAAAREIWRRLEHSSHPQIRVKAGYANVTTLLHAGEIGPEEALARLQAARPLWHGHPWEQTMLHGLAEVHLEGGDLPGAIRAWHDLIRHHPDSALADDARERIRAAFVAALASEEEAALDPIRAYALYRDFPELVPDGEAGSRIRRRLAAQLAALDLVVPAAAILRRVMEGQPAGPGRAELGADLAELRLRQPAPEVALAALADSAPPNGAPDPIESRRRRLEARALAALDRGDEALAVLDGADDADSQLLRAAILWRQRNWPRLIETIEPLVAGIDSPVEGDPDTGPSSESQALLLQLAVAHASRGDRAALDDLRERFEGALAGQPVAPAFRLVTLNSGPRDEPDALLATAEAHLAGLQSYLDQAAAH